MTHQVGESTWLTVTPAAIAAAREALRGLPTGSDSEADRAAVMVLCAALPYVEVKASL